MTKALFYCQLFLWIVLVLGFGMIKEFDVSLRARRFFAILLCYQAVTGGCAYE
jgi:hypothetical protein